MDEDERVKGPRMLTLAAIGSIVLWALVGLGICTAVKAEGGLAHMACSHPALPMPRTVVIRPGIDPAPWRAAIAEWNAFAARTVGPNRLRFVEMPQSYEADVYIVPASGRTWVDMPCGRVESVVYVGDDGTDLLHWATHELGHALGLADAIYDCQAEPHGYIGVMAYCADRREWWGGDDARALAWWF